MDALSSSSRVSSFVNKKRAGSTEPTVSTPHFLFPYSVRQKEIRIL